MRTFFALLFVAVSPVAAVQLVLSTGDFTSSDWTSHITNTSIGSSTATTEATGGNTGAYRRVSLTVGPFQNVTNAQIWQASGFTPSIQGAITSAVIRYDVTRVSTTNVSATQVQKGLAVMQNGIVHLSSLGVTTATPPTWTATASGNLLSLFPNVNWSSGNEILFGFYNAVSTSGTGFTIDGGYDNYSVTIDYVPVPEPGTGVLMLAPLALGIAFWRRRSGSR